MGGPKYPNQQLRSVSLETYFPGRLRAMSCLGEVQEAIEDELPNLFVPHLQHGEATALRPYQLRDKEGKRSLAIAVNQATFIAFDYPGYAAFRSEALSMLSKVHTALRLNTLNRIVYRYENVVGIGRDSAGLLHVEKLFPGVIPRALGASPVRAIEAMVETPWTGPDDHGSEGFHARVETEEGTEVLRVAVHAAVEGAGALERLGAIADVAHQRGRDIFEGLISAEFRSFISGEGNNE